MKLTVSKNIETIRSYILLYKDGLRVCAYIKMSFADDVSLVIGTGKYADNIVLLSDSEFLKEKERYSTQMDVEISEELVFNVATDETLINIECIEKPDEKYYWKLNFRFTKTLFSISTLVDELDYSRSIID